MSYFEVEDALQKFSNKIINEIRRIDQHSVTQNTEIARLRDKVKELEGRLDWLIKGNLSDDEIKRLIDET